MRSPTPNSRQFPQFAKSNSLLKSHARLAACVVETLEERRLLSISFAAPKVLSTGSVSASENVTSADFNGDGNNDLAVAVVGSGNLTIFPGNGDGTFGNTFNVPDGLHAGTPYYSMATAVFNGHEDVVVASHKQVSVVLGDGTGSFAAPALYGLKYPSYNVNAVATGDFNGDGNADIAVFYTGGYSKVELLPGNGDGTFGTPVVTEITRSSVQHTNVNTLTCAAGDFNGDGKDDLCCSNNDGNCYLLLSDASADGQFQVSTILTTSTPCVLASADVNNDGHPDIVACTTDGSSIYALLGTGDSSGDLGLPINSTGDGEKLEGIAICDCNGDGNEDLAMANANSTCTEDVGEGDGNFEYGATESSSPNSDEYTAHVVDIVESFSALASNPNESKDPPAASHNLAPAAAAPSQLPDLLIASPQLIFLQNESTTNTNQAPAITSAASTAFTVNAPSTFTFVTTASPTASLVERGALPAGITFLDKGNGRGKLIGTPAPGSAGDYVLTIVAKNGVTPNAKQTFTLTINNQPPTITSVDNAAFIVNEPGTFTFVTTASPTASLVERGALPAGITFLDKGNGRGKLIGTPLPGSAGNYVLTIVAKNGAVPNAKQTFTLTIGNQPPTITSASTVSFTPRIAGSFTVKTTGFPISAITETGALPAGITFTDNGNGKAKLAGTPIAGTAGTYPITIKAKNGAKPNAVQTFSLIVLHTVKPSAIASAPAFAAASIVTSSIGDDTILSSNCDPLDL